MKKVDMFLDLMFWSANQTHLWHLQTTDAELHSILKGYYEMIREELDEFAEAYIGTTGKLLSAKGKQVMVDFTNVNTVKTHFDKVETLINEMLKECSGIPQVKVLKDIIEDIAPFRYKLRMCKGYTVKGGTKPVAK